MSQGDNLSGHCAIVTGACGGIGMCFCRELSRRGSDIVMVDLNRERLEESASEIQKENPAVKVYIMDVDLTSSDIENEFDQYIASKDINPDILINNAGIFSFQTVIDTDERKVSAFIDLHVRAVTVLSRWFCLRRKVSGWGYLLNMSSMSCWMPMPGIALYSATKSYIRVFTRALHYEMRDSGVSVTVACPGGIATDLFGLPENLKHLAVNIKVLDTPERVTRKALDKMLKGKKQYINGLLNRFSILLLGMTPTPLRMTVKHFLLDKGITR